MKVVFLFGPVATGKLTIGQELSWQVGLPLFHNHMAVDIALTLFPFGTPEFVELRACIWRDSFRLAAQAGRSFIFTFSPESSVSQALLAELREAVESQGGEIVFVELCCSDAGIQQRLGNESRAGFGKLRDVADYQALKQSGAFDSPKMPKPDLRIDTETMSAANAAAKIAEYLNGLGHTYLE